MNTTSIGRRSVCSKGKSSVSTAFRKLTTVPNGPKILRTTDMLTS